MRFNRGGDVGAMVLVMALVAGACGSGGSSKKNNATATTKAKPNITVSSANFPENEMLADMYAAVLKKAGYGVTLKLKLGSREIYEPALESGQIDFIPEYAGNYLSFLDKNAPSLDVDTTVTRLKALLTPKNITVLEPSKATDADAIAVTKDFATKNNLTK